MERIKRGTERDLKAMEFAEEQSQDSEHICFPGTFKVPRCWGKMEIIITNIEDSNVPILLQKILKIKLINNTTE